MTSVFEPDRQGPVTGASSAPPAVLSSDGPPSPPQLSPDGRWFWTGQAWVPAPNAELGAHDDSGGTSGKAIAALVLGILWLWGVGSILALIFGFVARNDIKKRPKLGGSGMAVAGIVLGIVGIVGSILVTILIAVAANSVSNAIDNEQAVDRTLRNAATAEETYLTDNSVYTTNVGDLSATGFRGTTGVDFQIVSTDGSRRFCLKASKGEATEYYDSAAFGLTPFACA